MLDMEQKYIEDLMSDYESIDRLRGRVDAIRSIRYALESMIEQYAKTGLNG